MRNFILIIFILILSNNLISQNKKTINANIDNILTLVPVESIKETDKIVLLISELISYGDACKYGEELKSGNFKVEQNDKGYIIWIQKNKKSNYDKSKDKDYIEINKVSINNKKKDDYDLKIVDMEKVIDIGKHKEKLKYEKSGLPYWNLFCKMDLLIDKAILSGCDPDPYTNRIFNKERSTHFLNVPNSSQRSQTFGEPTDGTLVPDGNGTNAKLFIVDRFWHRIIFSDKEFLDLTLIKSFGSEGNGINQFFSPTGITYGRKDYEGYRMIYIADRLNNRILQYKYKDNNLTAGQFQGLFATGLEYPYDISFHNGPSDLSPNCILYFSERGNIYDIKAIDTYSQYLYSFDRFEYNGQTYQMNPGRLDTYVEYYNNTAVKSMLAYVDLELNAVIFFHLNNFSNSGLYPSGNPPVAFAAVQFPNTEKVTSVKFITGAPGSINPTNVLITTNDEYAYSKIHNCKIVFYPENGQYIIPGRVEYLASTHVVTKDNYPFLMININNIESQFNYEDIFTSSSDWQNGNDGLRRMKQGVCILGNNWGNMYYRNTGISWNFRVAAPVKALVNVLYKNSNNSWTPTTFQLNNVWTHTPISLTSGSSYFNLKLSIPSNVSPSYVHIRMIYYPVNEDVNSPYSQLIEFDKQVSTTPYGCPFVYSLVDSTFIPDNNILYKSELENNIGQDITDKYILNIYPTINPSDSIIKLKFAEAEYDYSSFDEVKLYAIDHPVDTRVGITENNDIVLYSPNLYSSLDTAIQNGDDVTDELQYLPNDTTIVDGNQGDYINAGFGGDSDIRLKFQIFKSAIRKSLDCMKKILFFKNFDVNKDIIADSVAMVLDSWNTNVSAQNKNIDAGIVTGYSSDGFYTTDPIPFARRQNYSNVIVPLAGSDINIDSLSITWDRDYSVSYLATTPIFYSGYIQTEIPLIEAIQNNQAITTCLQSQDGIYAEMDNTSEIVMKFKSSLPENPIGVTRDYCLVVNGRYVTQGDGDVKVNKLANNNSNIAPKSYELSQNFPNPFNPNTTIKYALPKDGFVSIKIYDIAGREIYKLVSENKKAGYYSTQFNGSTLASGVYFYRIQAGNFIQTKKMVLIK